MRSVRPSVAAPMLATSLIIAEFDIDTGACLRACYPRVPTTAAAAAAAVSPTSPSTPAATVAEVSVPPGIAGHTEYFANVMLPDGAEKVSVTRTVFVVNRPQPPSLLRFPVYRFCRSSDGSANRNSSGGAASSPSSSASPSPPAPASVAAESVSRWSRVAGEETALYVPEMLLIDRGTRAVSLRYKDTELEAPAVVPMDQLSSLPSLPPDVARFAKQLEAMLMNEATLAGSRTASFAGPSESAYGDGGRAGSPGTVAGSSSASAGAGGMGGGGSAVNGGGMSDYAFVVVAYDEGREEGYLMRVTQFERLFKELMLLESAAAAAASSTQAAAAGGDGSGPLGDGSRGPLADDGANPLVPDPLDLPHSESLGERTPTTTTPLPGDATAARDGLFHHGFPTPPSPEAGVGLGGNGVSPTNASSEQGNHLVLPRTDSMRSESDAADVSGTTQQRFADPSSWRPTARSAAADATAAATREEEAVAAASSGPVLFGLCAVVSKRDSTARRGGITKSVAVLGPSLVWLEPFFPILVAAAQYCCNVSGTSDEALRELQRILKRCYDSINNAASLVAAGRAKVDQLTAEIGKYCTLGSGQQAYVYYNDSPFGSVVKAKIPLSPESNDIAFAKYNIETLIETLGPSSMQLILGVLTEKKILILSRKGEASDVCEVALSLGIIGNLLDRNFMATKVFPYISVSSVDYFLRVPGYIVGTLNPIFENVTPWGWDLLCDLDNKTVVTAAERAARRQASMSPSGGGNWATATAGLANAVGVGSSAEAEALRSLPAPLQLLYKKLVRGIYYLRALRVGAVERNRRLRLVLEDFLYTTVLVGYVAGGTVSVPSTLYPTFAHRSLSVLRLEMTLTSMLDQVSSQVLHPRESPALLLQCAALRQCAAGDMPVQRTLVALLEMLNSPYDIKLFLRRMTLAVGGLNAVGMQLTHPSPDARAAAAVLLSRVESIPEGKAAVASMNNFFLMIYENGVKGARR